MKANEKIDINTDKTRAERFEWILEKQRQSSEHNIKQSLAQTKYAAETERINLCIRMYSSQMQMSTLSMIYGAFNENKR